MFGKWRQVSGVLRNAVKRIGMIDWRGNENIKVSSDFLVFENIQKFLQA